MPSIRTTSSELSSMPGRLRLPPPLATRNSRPTFVNLSILSTGGMSAHPLFFALLPLQATHPLPLSLPRGGWGTKSGVETALGGLSERRHHAGHLRASRGEE